MKKTIWISFDFGMKGDYEGLYKWLDENEALERGYGLALIKKYDFPEKYVGGENPDNIFKNYVKKEIENNATIEKSDRIYMIWRSLKDKKLRGTFLFGNKKAAPWTGFSRQTDDDVDYEFDLE